MRFTPTPRGARLARHLVCDRLDAWGFPYGSGAHEDLALITGELAANAVHHGHVAGRDFHVRLAATPDMLRVEVADTRTERRPVLPSPATAPSTNADATVESGRGLVLVAALASEWGVRDRTGAPGKTVWAAVRVSPVGGP